MNTKVLDGFKQFIIRGNAIDLAVGVVIGAAFGKVVDAIVKGILTPLLAVIIHTPDFSSIYLTIGKNRFLFGSIIDEIISFILVAAAIYFFVVVPMNTFMKRVSSGQEPTLPTKKQCEFCITEIHIDATRCPHCTAELRK